MIQFFKKLLGLGPTEVKQEVISVAIVETAPAEVVDTAVAPDATAPGNWPFPTGQRPDDTVKPKAKAKAPSSSSIFSFLNSAILFSIITGRFLEFTLPVIKNKNNGIPFILMGTLFGPVMGVTFSLMAVKKLDVAVAQTIFALLPVIVLPINYFIYKERITLSAILACLISIAGVFLLIWRNQLMTALF